MEFHNGGAAEQSGFRNAIEGARITVCIPLGFAEGYSKTARSRRGSFAGAGIMEEITYVLYGDRAGRRWHGMAFFVVHLKAAGWEWGTVA